MSAPVAGGPPSGVTCHPTVYQNTGASILKGEDVLLVEHQRPWPGCSGGGEESAHGDLPASNGSARCSCCGADTAEYSIFAVFDGHNGVAAAKLVSERLVAILEERLPQGVPPPATSPTWVPWREDVQLAMVEIMAELNRLFALKGILAGCTATLVLQVGWLLTCANLGDSRAILDTGLETISLTVDHRVATHQGERRRVEAMGNNIAPIDFTGSGPATRMDNGVGPLRIWPGGLCLSRAVGDFDVGDSVIPFPHIMQVIVPPSGARLLVASDGVWDAYEKMTRIGSMLRNWSLDTCPQRLIQSIVRAYGGLRDDTSLVIADILPPGKSSFPEAVQAVQTRAKLSGVSMSGATGNGGSGGGGGGGGCGCFGGSAPPPPPAPPAPKPAAAPAAPAVPASAAFKVEVVADVDVAAIMGLMPEETPSPPGWYDEFVGEQLFALAAEAMACWREANERRTGRRPSTPQLEATVRAARVARMSTQSGGSEMESEGSMNGVGIRRHASVFFDQAVAGEGDYADKFGHYKGFEPGSIGSDSPGSSLHSARAGSEGSVRAGGYRYADASVRAGNRYNDPSVRAGSRYLDPSVRAGAAYYAAAGGISSTRGSMEEGLPNPSFRPDPSIRSGADALRMLSDSAGSGGPRPLASAAAGTAVDVSGARQQRGLPPSPFDPAPTTAAAAAPAGGGGSAPKNGEAVPEDGRCGSASSASVPIPVPRNVTFGAVDVMGNGNGGGGGGKAGPTKGGPAELEDSPMGFASGSLQAAGNGGSMDTIPEG